jgi:beta-1,3-galactosyltransferase 1
VLLTLMPRRFFRLILISFILIFVSIFLLQASGHGPSISQISDAAAEHKAHEKVVPNQEDSHEALRPFPETPMVSPAEGDPDNRMPASWLAAVISPAQDVDRRMLIRSTWMRMYADVPFDPRFVISNPGSKWLEAVRFENRTYGDMIVLDHLPENSATANTIKTLEFYKWLVKQGRRYEFVSKIDTDLFLNARGFWDRYIEPRLANTTASSSSTPAKTTPAKTTPAKKATVERTVIGQLYYSRPHDQAYPHGSMYTHTWDLIELLAKLQEKDPVVMGEDQAVGKLLQNAGEQVHLVNMNATEKFDYDDADARTADSPWARTATHPMAMLHALYGRDELAVHQLKDRNLFMKIANAFDSKGIKAPPRFDGPEKRPPFFTRLHDFLDSFSLSTHFEGQMERIPDALYHRQGNDWIVDKVWNMGTEMTGYQKDL